MIKNRSITLPTSDVPEGEVFTVSQLPAMRSVRLLTRLGKVLGPAASELGRALATTKGETPQVEALAPALGALFSQLEPDTVEQLLRELFATTKVGATDLMPVFDMKMAGQFNSIWKLAATALEVQFGNFFGDLIARGMAAVTQNPAPASGT